METLGITESVAMAFGGISGDPLIATTALLTLVGCCLQVTIVDIITVKADNVTLGVGYGLEEIQKP